MQPQAHPQAQAHPSPSDTSTMHPVERVQAYCRALQAILDERSHEATDGLGKALSDVLMQMHNQAPEWHTWHEAPELSDVDAWLREELEAEQRWEEERRKRARGEARGIVAV